MGERGCEMDTLTAVWEGGSGGIKVVASGIKCLQVSFKHFQQSFCGVCFPFE